MEAFAGLREHHLPQSQVADATEHVRNSRRLYQLHDRSRRRSGIRHSSSVGQALVAAAVSCSRRRSAENLSNAAVRCGGLRRISGAGFCLAQSKKGFRMVKKKSNLTYRVTKAGLLRAAMFISGRSRSTVYAVLHGEMRSQPVEEALSLARSIAGEYARKVDAAKQEFASRAELQPKRSKVSKGKLDGIVS